MNETTTPLACGFHQGSGSRPDLSRYLTARRTPLMWLVPPDGEVCCGADGLYAANRRLLSLWRITVDDRTLSNVVAELFSADGMRIVSHVPSAAGQSRDPQATVTRIRVVRASGAGEQIEVVNPGRAPFSASLRLSASSDLAASSDLQAGHPSRLLPWTVEQGTAIACHDDKGVTIRLPADAVVASPKLGLLHLSWKVRIPPGGSWRSVTVIKAISGPS